MYDWFIVLVYIITCFGISTILIDSVGPWHIFEKWHNWMDKHTPVLNELFSCYICLPTWEGIIFSTLNIIFLPFVPITPVNMLLGTLVPWWIIIPLDAAFTSGSVWLIHTIQAAIWRFADE